MPPWLFPRQAEISTPGAGDFAQLSPIRRRRYHERLSLTGTRYDGRPMAYAPRRRRPRMTAPRSHSSHSRRQLEEYGESASSTTPPGAQNSAFMLAKHASVAGTTCFTPRSQHAIRHRYASADALAGSRQDISGSARSGTRSRDMLKHIELP